MWLGVALRREGRTYDKGVMGQGHISRLYTPEVISQLTSLLNQARQAATDEPKIQARIDFLKIGLDYADTQARLVRLYEKSDETDKKQGQQLMDKLHRMYMKILRDHPLALNVAWHRYRQGPSFNRAFDWSPPEESLKQ